MATLTTQYVRAGACTQGTILSLADQFTCALASTDCAPGQKYWSSQQLAEELAAPAADCLTAASSNLALQAQCQGAAGFDLKVGACLVDGTIYQCAASQQGCEDPMSYMVPDALMSTASIQCLLCGLDPSMDGAFSDLLPNGSVTPTSPSDAAGGGTTEFGATTDGGIGATTEFGATTPSGGIDGTTQFGATTPADPGVGGTTAAAGEEGDQDGDVDGDDGDYYDYYDGPETTDATEGGMDTGATTGAYDPMGTGATTAAAGDEYPGYGTDPTTSSGYDWGSSGDGSSSDPKNNSTNLYDEFENLNETEKMEAAAVFGIVVGILVGCCLLLWLQRQCRKCCGNDGIEKHNGRRLVGDEMGHATSDDDDDLEDRMI